MQLGNDLRMSVVVREITGDFKKWEAACRFANTVMATKKTDE